MNNEKMREAFNAWWKNGGHRMDCGGIQAGIIWDNAWQAAIAAAQRDSMAVAEAVRTAMVQSCESWPGIVEATKRVDLASIVEAVQPATKPEPEGDKA